MTKTALGPAPTGPTQEQVNKEKGTREGKWWKKMGCTPQSILTLLPAADRVAGARTQRGGLHPRRSAGLNIRPVLAEPEEARMLREVKSALPGATGGRGEGGKHEAANFQLILLLAVLVVGQWGNEG